MAGKIVLRIIAREVPGKSNKNTLGFMMDKNTNEKQDPVRLKLCSGEI